MSFSKPDNKNGTSLCGVMKSLRENASNVLKVWECLLSLVIFSLLVPQDLYIPNL